MAETVGKKPPYPAKNKMTVHTRYAGVFRRTCRDTEEGRPFNETAAAAYTAGDARAIS